MNHADKGVISAVSQKPDSLGNHSRCSRNLKYGISLTGLEE